MKTLIIDTSVFNKLFLDEPDSDDVVTLFDKARDEPIRLMAPDLLYLEVINTANTYRLPVQQIIELIEFQTRHLLTLRSLTANELKKAVDITQIDHPKSGYPSIYDAVFHAMAICNDATLITADQRHHAKTKHLGSISLLQSLA